MKSGFLLSLILLLPCSSAFAAVELKSPQTHPGTYVDMRSQQALGRVEVSSDGRFVVYEWGRPYFGWVPETRWMAPKAARRLQTFLYKVDLSQPDPTSEYLFYPNEGCTYWLGDMSPDGRRVIVFELSHDDHNVRAGIWSFDGAGKPVQWFAPRVNEGSLAESSAWISNDEFVYPVLDQRTLFVRVTTDSGEVRPCKMCSAAMLRSIRAKEASTLAEMKAIASRIDNGDVPQDAALTAAAANGSLAVFVRDNPETLSLLFKESDRPVTVVFENARK